MWGGQGGGLTGVLFPGIYIYIGFFSDAKQKLAKGFMSAADGLRESFRFAHTFSDDVKQEFGYKE